jgi:hypothetical protein
MFGILKVRLWQSVGILVVIDVSVFKISLQFSHGAWRRRLAGSPGLK